MKQHITTKQLNELSEKGKKALWKWAKDKEFEHFGYWDKGNRDLPLLSIGQMFEFLDEHYALLSLEKRGGNKPYWIFGTCEKYEKNKSPVDTLWEAVKEVLEK